MAKKTRNRELARLAARRRSERRDRRRKRRLALISVLVVVGLVGSVVAFAALGGGDEPPPSASPTEEPTEGPTGPTSTEPGEPTGTVVPTAGPDEVACGAEAPDAALEPKPQFAAPAQVTQQRATYTATLQTSCGDIVIELLADRAPETVNSFVFLAQQGYFDGQRIHRLDTSIDVIQGGDPTATGGGGPGYTIPDELSGDETYGPGTFAMANTGAPDSGGSQFFLITGENGHLLDDVATYTVFGRVIEGLDVAERIQRLPIQDPTAGIAGQQPEQAVYLERVTIAES